VLDAVRAIADEEDIPPAQVSLAWLLHKEVVDAPIIGPRQESHLEQSVDALDVDLTRDQIEQLEAPLYPQWPVKGKN
jgi:aryl-alcohol dehydrogenase-like predicted oxidoreductase